MIRKLTLVLFALAFSCTSLMAINADVDGAEPGKWTQDMDAARKLAKSKDLPILVNFTGSDWCGWCKLMDKEVFAKEKWQEYAKANIVLVAIDFPKNKSIVPKKYVDRNDDLKEAFGVRGFPTFIVLDNDGTTKLGQLGANRDVTPEGFIADLNRALRYRAAAVAKYVSGMGDADKAQYMKIVKQIQDCSKGISEADAQIAAAKKRIETLEEDEEELKEKAAEFRAKQLGPEKLKEYQQLKSDLEAATESLKSYMASRPARTRANMEKMQGMSKKVQDLEAKLGEF